MTSASDEAPPARPHLHFSLAPESACVWWARERIRDYLARHWEDKTAVNDVVLAVEEACANAICHSGSSEEIEIRLIVEDDRLEATVKDRGCGFDVGSFDPHCVPDPLVDHGRGLFLMATLCDEMKLSLDGGLEVRLAKRAVL